MEVEYNGPPPPRHRLGMAEMTLASWYCSKLQELLQELKPRASRTCAVPALLTKGSGPSLSQQILPGFMVQVTLAYLQK